MLGDLLKHLDRVLEMPSGDARKPGLHKRPGASKTARLTVRLCEELSLDFADALILAHALADPHSTHLITDDTDLQSNKVRKFEAEMRNNGERERELSVTDRFSHG